MRAGHRTSARWPSSTADPDRLRWALPDRRRAGGDPPPAAPVAPFPPDPLPAAAGAGLAAVGRRPRIRPAQPRAGRARAGSRRRGATPDRSRTAPGPSSGPIATTVGDQFPARTSGRTHRHVHQMAPRRRRRSRGRGRHRVTAGYTPTTPRHLSAAVDTRTTADGPSTAPRQPPATNRRAGPRR